MNKRNNIANLNRKQDLVCFFLFHLYGGKTNQNANLSISVEAMRFVGFRAVFPSIGYGKFSKATDIQSVIIGMQVISIETRPITSGIRPITSGIGPITSGIHPITTGTDRVRFVSEKTVCSILNLQMLQTKLCFKFQKNILFLKST